MIFDHCCAIYYYFPDYFATWSKYFVNLGKYISCLGVLAIYAGSESFGMDASSRLLDVISPFADGQSTIQIQSIGEKMLLQLSK